MTRITSRFKLFDPINNDEKEMLLWLVEVLDFDAEMRYYSG